MKRFVLFLSFCCFILSGFTFFQGDDFTCEVDRTSEILVANYARMTGLLERVKALNLKSDSARDDLEEAGHQLSGLMLESEKMFRDVSEKIKKRKDRVNLLLWVKEMELNDSFSSLQNMKLRIETAMKMEDVSEEDNNAVVRKLMQYFRRHREQKEVHVVFNSDDKIVENLLQKGITAENHYMENSVSESDENDQAIAMIREELEGIRTLKDSASEKIASDWAVSLLKTPDHEKLNDSSIVFELANAEGNFEYLAVRGRGEMPEDISRVDYLRTRAEDAMSGDMFTVTEDIAAGKKQQEISFSSVRYRYSQALNRYIRTEEGVVAAECDNLIFQLIKSDRESGFRPDDIGFGNMMAFVGGNAVMGVWLKESAETPVKYYDTEGNLLKVKKGKTWVEVLPEEMEISHHTI